MRRRTTVLVTTAALAAAMLPLVAAGPSAAAPGDVRAVTLGTVGVDFRQDMPEFVKGVARDGSVLISAIATTDIYQGLYVVRPDGVAVRASTDSAGNGYPDESLSGGAISDDGRYVAFFSRNFSYGGDHDDTYLVLKDLTTGAATRLANVGTQRTGCANRVIMAVADGAERVMFSTTVALDPADVNEQCDVYVWEAATGATRLLTSGAVSPNGLGSLGLAMTPDARHLLYISDADVLPPVVQGRGDLYLVDLVDGTTTLESVDINGDRLPSGVSEADLSDDASIIAFTSLSDPTRELELQAIDVFLRDRSTGAVIDPSVPSFTGANGPSLSGDGSHLAVQIDWTRLSTLGLGTWGDVAVYDIEDASWQLASHRLGEPTVQGDYQSARPVISPTGAVVAFDSYALDLTASTGTPVERRSAVFTYEVTGLTPPDADADGILDVVDADGGDGSQPGRFEDVIAGQSPTSGVITSVAAGMTVSITDEADPSGVLISVTGTAGSARLTVCGAFALSLRAGTTTAITCGSVRTRVDAGEVVVELPDGVTVTVPAGVEAKVDDLPDGSFSVDVLASGAGQVVTIDNGGATSGVGVDDPVRIVRTWTFTGFARPVDGGGTVNVVKGGSVVPLRWSLTDGGAPVLGLTTAGPTFVRQDCWSGAPLDVIEEVVPRASGLLDLGGGSYQLNWRTPTSAGCGQLRLDVGDGVAHTAQFRLR